MGIDPETGETVITESILNFVDLAGSERVAIHDNMRLRKDNAGSLFFSKTVN